MDPTVFAVTLTWTMTPEGVQLSVTEIPTLISGFRADISSSALLTVVICLWWGSSCFRLLFNLTNPIYFSFIASIRSCFNPPKMATSSSGQIIDWIVFKNKLPNMDQQQLLCILLHSWLKPCYKYWSVIGEQWLNYLFSRIGRLQPMIMMWCTTKTLLLFLLSFSQC